MTNIKNPKNPKKFECIHCNYMTSSKKDYEKHLLTRKHQIRINNGSEVMLIQNKKLSVVPITTHINIKSVSKKININLIIKKMTTLQKDFKKLFNKKPKIGILGLNPHNAELTSNSKTSKNIEKSI